MDASTKQGMELGEELQGKKVFDLVYMVTKGLPNTCLEKQFGVTIVDLGWHNKEFKQCYRCVSAEDQLHWDPQSKLGIPNISEMWNAYLAF